MYCGLKTYTSLDCPWLQFATPTYPLTTPFDMKIATNDYTLSGPHTCNVEIAFAEATYPATLAHVVTVNLKHPCLVTLLTTTQTIPGIDFPFGDPELRTSFVAFSDSVSEAYGIPDFCQLTYSLEVAADATMFGVSVDNSVAPPEIVVFTTDSTLKGQQVSLTM